MLKNIYNETLKTEQKEIEIKKRDVSRLHRPCVIVTVGDSKWPQCDRFCW